MLDEILFRSLRGEVTAAERDAVNAWRRAAAENEARYCELRRLLDLVSADDQSASTPTAPSAGGIVREAEKRRRWQARGRRRRWLGVGLAAAVPLAAAAILLLTVRGKQPAFAFGAGEFATGSGETATVALGDGSVLRLAPNSRLRVMPSRAERSVWLEGRAYFAVAKMPGYPFRVQTSAGAVTVLGTRFDLQSLADQLSLVVVEGRVALAAAGHRTTVRAGEMSAVNAGKLSDPAKVPDVDRVVAWTGKFLVFQAAPLSVVAAELEHHYGVRVDLNDPVLAQRTVTTWLSESSLDQAVSIVCTIADAECSVRDGVVRMAAR